MTKTHVAMRQYIFSFMSVCAALGLTLYLRPYFLEDSFLLCWVAGILSTLYGGLKAGLISIFAGIILVNYFLVLPGELQIQLIDVIRFALFVGLALLIHGLVSALKRSEEKQRFLAQAGELLNSSFDYQTTLAEVARLAVPTLADWCVLDVVGVNGELRRLAIVHHNPEKQHLAVQLQTRYPVIKPTDQHTLLNVLQSGRVHMVSEFPDTRLKAEARDNDHYLLLRELGFRSEIVTRLEARGQILGAITLVAGDSGRRFSQKDLVLVQELAHRAALAIDNARLFRETQSQREQLRIILSSIADGVLATDKDQKITFMNPVAAKLTGWPESDAIGKRLEDVFATVTPALSSAVPYHAELSENTLLMRDNRYPIAIEQYVTPIRDATNQIEGVVVAFRDISERQRLELERVDILRREHEARIAAEAANHLKLQFLGMVSHELRTPLTSIKGFISTLLATDIVWPPEQQREFLNIAAVESDKLTELVEHLLDVSQLRSGTLRIWTEAHSPEEIINTAWAQLQTIAADHCLKLDIEPGLPPVIVDERRIAQVIVNLVSNAVKHAPKGSEIALKISLSQAETLQFTVSDQGQGIPEAERERVFEPFRQIDHRSTGVGLGLAICKGLVEAHGGRIWISDNPYSNKGVSVSFTIPAASQR
jgi:PAS domain S-box-containing protein